MTVGTAVALARRNAAACETAERPRCSCHCGGALHGKRHSEAEVLAAAHAAVPEESEAEVGRELYAQLERAATLRAQLRLELGVE